MKKLEWILSRATGYFGLTNYLGSRFLAADPAYDAFAGAAARPGPGLHRRRLGGAPGRRHAPRLGRAGDRRPALRAPPSTSSSLALEAGALQRGQALGSGFAYPVTLEKVARWAEEVEQRGYQLAPASALTAKR